MIRKVDMIKKLGEVIIALEAVDLVYHSEYPDSWWNEDTKTLRLNLYYRRNPSFVEECILEEFEGCDISISITHTNMCFMKVSITL